MGTLRRLARRVTSQAGDGQGEFIMMRFASAFGVAVLMLLGSAAPGEGDSAQGEPPSLPPPLKVVGTQVRNSRDEPVLLRGVNAACMEWTSDGEGHIVDTVKTAIKDWHVNHIRLPLAQDRWFGKAPEQKDDGKAYCALVQQVVDTCASQG